MSRNNPRTRMLKQPHVRAKIIGGILIIFGLYFILLQQSGLYLKTGVAIILIGLFTMFLVTEKTTPKHISDAQIQGNLETIRRLTDELNLKGNAVFLPQSSILNQEKIFIPLEANNPRVPDVDDELMFYTGTNDGSLGLALPPSGAQLLHQIEQEHPIETTTPPQVEEQLQTMVGMDLVRSITLKQQPNQHEQWQLQLEKPSFCPNDPTLCRQYPCPTCSAALAAITRATNQKIWINDVDHNGKNITFNLKMGD